LALAWLNGLQALAFALEVQALALEIVLCLIISPRPVLDSGLEFTCSFFVLKQMQHRKKANGTNMVVICIKCLTAFVQVGLALPRYGLDLWGPGLGREHN